MKAQIIEKSLVFDRQETLSPNPPDGYSDWIFNNCYCILFTSGNYYVQVGSSGQEGSIITKPLEGLSGNARIVFQAYSIDDNQKICLGAINGETEETLIQYTSKAIGEYESVSYLLTDGTGDTRLKFFSQNPQNSNPRRFQVKDVVVTDIGEKLYDESFDKLLGDETMDFSAKKRSGADVKLFDYPNSDTKSICSAYHCIYFQNSSSSFTTAPITTANENAHVAISFRVAGDNDLTSSTPLTVTYNIDEKETISTKPTVVKKSWKTINYTTNYFHLNRGIKFSGQNFFLDDIKVMPVFDVTIDEQADNSSILQKRSGNHVDATLHRTLTAGIWNTLCLPFAVSNTMISNSATIRQLTSVSNGVYNFKTVNNVPAGEPFLVKVNETVTNPTFTDVVIEAPTPTTKTFGNYGFAGVYSPTQLNVDGTHLFLGTDGYLYAPSDANSNTINGMRAYFVLPSGNARVAFVEDEEAAGITEHNREQIMSDGCYNLIGQPVSSPARGLYIVDGKKTLMK